MRIIKNKILSSGLSSHASTCWSSEATVNEYWATKAIVVVGVAPGSEAICQPHLARAQVQRPLRAVMFELVTLTIV